ncbi:PREDICTED: uncharacterized protein LOC106742153 [Dinoponera quadriceps]|uniref:Uncharacterized protein LOC106742153 n=1 Tax=Dinoponera quadriceps TaxID=609295 RepID=A0A6P3WVY8_DINQU|nr:PREDICTED: uncharacterized protein LOC106742153 [Dinoponera quadriceps]
MHREDAARVSVVVLGDGPDCPFAERRRRRESPTDFHGRGGRRSDNTAWLQKLITRRTGGGDKPRTRRGRLLLLVLYLLAWPLLCSAHLASTFAQNPTLGHAKNPAQRNATPSYTNLFSSSTVVAHQHQQPQQYVQGGDYSTEDSERRRHRKQPKRERTDHWHPYGKYSWEVNQVNPWLSACDLAGPAPADLQGSCGPPEVPKYCPMPCAATSRDPFREVIDVSTGVTTTTTTTTMMIRTKTRLEKADRRGAYTEEAGVRTAPEQCLFYLEESHKRDICRDDFGRASTRSFLTPRENRYWFMSGLRLRHCCEHAVVNALAPGKAGPLDDVLNGGLKCADALDKLLLVDALAARLHCEFEEVLARYDCAQPYSVIHNCTHCKEAYRKWVCSSLVPYFAHGGPMDAKSPESSWTGTRLRPCRSFCQSVEQRCPYLLPGDRAPAYPTQYAGEPTFLCRDPNIPETGGQAARALHSSDDDECCFHVCSEDAPGTGICANCTEPWKHGRAQDPPTAPQCEINPPQADVTDQQYPGSQAGQPEVTTDRGLVDDDTDAASSSTSITPTSSTTVSQQDASFCGSGRIGSIPSASSLGRSTPPVALQLLWLCSMVLISLSGNGALHNNLAFWGPSALLRLIGTSCLLLRACPGLEGSLRFAFLGPRAAKIAVVRNLLFVLGMSRRAVMKCRRRGWWWWRSWRRSSSRHFRWKSRLKEEERRPRVLRRIGGRTRGRAHLEEAARVAIPRGIARSRRWEGWRRSRLPTPDVAFCRSVLRDASVSILGSFPQLAAACSRRFRDWWYWWLWRWWRKRRRKRRRRRWVYCGRIVGTDVACSAKSMSKKDPP